MEPTNKLSYVKKVIIGLVLMASVITIWDQVQYVLGIGWASDLESEVYADDDLYGNSYVGDGCTVAGVQFHGDLYTYYDPELQSTDDIASSEDISYYLSLAEDTPNIEVILLEIDSYGGTPVASQELADTLQTYVTKPVVVQIRQSGLSGAYWVASAGDYIFASALSDIGSIGVTMSYLDESKLNEKDGYTYNQISSGKFKDSGDPQKVLTAEEKAIFQRDVDITHAAFVTAVAVNRGMDSEAVRSLADCSSMMGEMALENGLIDEVGGYYEILDYIEGAYGVDPMVCW